MQAQQLTRDLWKALIQSNIQSTIPPICEKSRLCARDSAPAVALRAHSQGRKGNGLTSSRPTHCTTILSDKPDERVVQTSPKRHTLYHYLYHLGRSGSLTAPFKAHRATAEGFGHPVSKPCHRQRKPPVAALLQAAAHTIANVQAKPIC